MELVGQGFYFEDYPVGRKFRTVGRTITEPDLVNFVNCTGMVEVLFTNLEYLRNESLIKGRLVPGVLAYAIAEGLLVQSVLQGTGLAFTKMDFEVIAPIFVGDTIHVEVEVLEARSRPDRPTAGMVRTANRIVKHDGKVAIVYHPSRLIRRRPAQGEAS